MEFGDSHPMNVACHNPVPDPIPYSLCHPMPDLIAQGVEPQQRWRRSLPEGESVLLGRLTGTWAVPWDQHVSRRHARLLWSGKRLEVVRAAGYAEPDFSSRQGSQSIYHRAGRAFRHRSNQLHPGRSAREHHRRRSPAGPAAIVQSAQYLRQVQFRNPDHRIEVLTRLPDVISGAAGDEELFVRLVSMLLAGVPRADAAAVVAVERI